MGSSTTAYLKRDLRTAFPARVVALSGCLTSWMARMGFGVAFRLTEAAVPRTELRARRTGLGSPRSRLIGALPFPRTVMAQLVHGTLTRGRIR